MDFKSQSETGLQLLQRLIARPLVKNLTSLLPDELTNEIIEITGNTSTGKTLFLTECIAKCITPQNYNGLDIGVVFIDLDGQFDIAKLATIIKRLVQDADEELIKSCLNKLTVINCYDSPTLYVTFQRLKLYLTEQNQIGLVILDSVSANYWQDSMSGGEKYMDTYVNKIISSLKLYLEDFKVPILFTRQRYFYSKNSDSSLDYISRKILFQKLNSSYHVTVTRKNVNYSMTLNFDLCNAQNLEQIIKCLQFGCMPEVPFDEDHVSDRNEVFLTHLKIAKSILKELAYLLTKFLNNDVSLQIKPRDLLQPCLYLCGEHCQPNFLWSDKESYLMMNLCIEKLYTLMHFSNIEELLTNIEIAKIFVGLQYKLEKNNWKKYPAAVECFMWILKNLKMPHLNSLLYLVMPLPLNMFDDYDDYNIMISLKAFQHIIDNTPAAELAMSGHDVVLYKSLENSLRSSEYQLLPHIIKCVLLLISKMQLKYLNMKNSLEWTKFDDVMNILLPRMGLEHKSEPAECYALILPFVLESVGIACIRWSERLIPLFAEYMMQKHSILATVKAIEVYIKQTWPKTDTHWNVLLSILIKALYNEDQTDVQPNEENIMAIVECIKTLIATRPECIHILKQLKECKEFQSKKIFVESLIGIIAK